MDGDSAIHNTLRLDGAGEGTYARAMDGIQRLKTPDVSTTAGLQKALIQLRQGKAREPRMA